MHFLLPALLLASAAPRIPTPATTPSPAAATASPAPATTPSPAASASAKSWEVLEPGLELGTFAAPVKSTHGDSMIRVLRVDPARFAVTLLNASAPGEGTSRTARDWASRHDLVAAINSSMFKDDMKTSVSRMATRGHVNNAEFSKDKAVLVFDRIGSEGAAVRLLDRDCDSLEEHEKKYGSMVQSIRMVSCEGKNVWSQQPRKWSTALIGADGEGRILFIHARSPWSTHDLIDMLLALPIGLKRAMYVEGGPEAQLYVHTGKRELELIGSYETGFYESDDNVQAWPVPNVIGIKRIPEPKTPGPEP